MAIKKVRAILLLILLASLFSNSLNTVLGADPDFPQWQVGNYWKYNVEFTIGEINFVGTETITVENDNVDVFQNGQNFNCYQISLVAGGTIYGGIEGSGIAGTWTQTDEQYYTKSDQSWVKIHSTYEERISVNDNSGTSTISTIQEEFTTRTFFDITYNPPFEANKGFPLSAGKSWSAATTETVKAETTFNGNTETTTDSEAYTKTFLVIRKESITVSIGETETYYIKRTDPDGAYAEIYYSPEVGSDVKQIEYDSTGKIIFKIELLNYEYSSIRNDLGSFGTGPLMILIIALLIAIFVIATIYLLRKKKRMSIL